MAQGFRIGVKPVEAARSRVVEVACPSGRHMRRVTLTGEALSNWEVAEGKAAALMARGRQQAQPRTTQDNGQPRVVAQAHAAQRKQTSTHVVAGPLNSYDRSLAARTAAPEMPKDGDPRGLRVYDRALSALRRVIGGAR